MFGIEVLVWDGGQPNPSYFQLIKNYLFGGPIGHSAIKLTIPCDAETDQLIQRYCQNDKGESIIPHYQLEHIVTGKRVDSASGEVKYYPQPIKIWQIYFSWWPNGLQFEYKDRLLENTEYKVEYEEKWASYLDVQYQGNRGFVRRWFGQRLNNWLFGEKALPISTIIHPHPERDLRMDELIQAQTISDNCLVRLEESLEEINKTVRTLTILDTKLRSAGDNFRNMTYFLSDEAKAEQQRKLINIKKSIDGLETLLNKILSRIEIQNKKLIKYSADLDRLKCYFYSEIATIGKRPTQTFSLPLRAIAGACVGLDVELMLKKMNRKITKDDRFSIHSNNCSDAVLEILRAGLSKEVSAQLQASQCLKTSYLESMMVECPAHVVQVVTKLEQGFRNYRLLQTMADLETTESINAEETPAKPFLTMPRKNAEPVAAKSTRPEYSSRSPTIQ